MTTKVLCKVNDVKRLIKIGLFIIISLVVYIISYQTHANSIEFSDTILAGFPGITGSINYAHFNYGGNNFAGIFFLSDPGYSGNTITLGGQTKTCTRQIKGLYYNDQRGYRFRPLDQTTLDTLKDLDSAYNALTISGGWYTLCSGTNPTEIYGQIIHTRSGTIFNMIAGATYNLSTNSYTGGLSGNLKFFNNITGYFRDQRGGVSSFRGTGIAEVIQIGTCTGVVANGVYYNLTTGYTINQTRDGTSRIPTTGGVYTGSPTSNSCNFNCIGGYNRSGLISQCVLIVGSYCGDGTIDIGSGEQCDDGGTTAGDGCSSGCLFETPSCALANNSPKYTGQNVTFTGTASGRVAFDWLGFGDGTTGTWASNTTGLTVTTGHIYSSTGSYIATLKVKSTLSGSITNTCTGSVSILGASGAVCGNSLVETGEQCDYGNTTDGDGCSSTCQFETPSCTLTNNSPKYTGQNVTFTGTALGRVAFDWLGFGDGTTGTWASNTTGLTVTTGHIYSSTGTYIATLNVKNIFSGNITNICTGSVSILGASGAVCGNSSIETGEQCDDGNTITLDGCSATCQLETPICTGLTVTPTTGYIPLSVVFSGTKNSRANYTLNFGTGSSTGTFTLPLTNIYSSTGTFTYSLTGINPLSGSFTCIQTGTIIASYSGLICRSGRTNQSGTCILIGTGNTTITGTITSGTTFSLPGNITIYSSGSNTGGYLQISGINSVIISYGNRNGILIPPTILTAGSCYASASTLTSISSGLTNPTILLEFQAGASGSTVTASGGYFTIKVKVNSGTIGNTYRIFRSIECGTGREKVYVDELCILDSNKMCEFRTNKLSYFNIVSNSTLGSATPVIVGTIPRLRNAQIDKAYMSNPFTIANFNDITLATVTKGMLYVNGIAIGTSGYVQNGDELNIELYSSKKYDTTISSKITVGSIYATFYITTMVEGDDNTNDLSNLQKLRIMSIFNLLIELYSDDSSKEEEFLYTLRSMLMDKLEIIDKDDDAYSTFEYLLSLIEARLLVSGIDESNHIAPNCKEYEVKFDEDQTAYYSPDFKKVQYFSTRESLTRYIDSKNPGDCRINTYGTNHVDTTNTDPDKHIAPNGKVYKIESSDAGYTSPDLSSTKYFDTLQGLRAYLNINNPAITIRDHTIDTSFTAINHIAPNGKVYKIYKTDKGYMSYGLIKVRYFTTLESIKSFINQNNKI